MAIEGIKLAIIGMSVVFLFLTLLIVLIALSARLLKTVTENEKRALDLIRPPRKRSPVAGDQGDSRIVAVIGAALAAHRSRTMKR